ncbi:DUF928 domain-containing protein [Mucilaginibacter sp. Mucisp84]|uniref:DUF928 domain-containing protein n=1 Tax=Mucilaginibacter sp. Mucisp84 TaxID=3243058 RepID=UPI0039A69DDE
MMKKYLLFLFLALSGYAASAQLNISFIPETYGRNVNGLFFCRITNSGGKLNVSMTITVTERKGGIVCRAVLPEFSLFPGTNPIPTTAAHSAGIRFGDSQLGQISGRTGSFPEGDYEYCYEITFQHSDNPPFEQCFSYTLAPFAELNLVDPYNKEKICDKRPTLSWQPLIPVMAGARYQLVLAEIKAGQSPTEALNYNLPILNQTNLTAPVLVFPPVARELQPEKKYAWQVTAFKDQTILNRSEIWEFNVHCPDTLQKKVDSASFRFIEDLAQGNRYLALGSVRFAVVNPYVKQELHYKIRALDQPDKKIKHLPKLLLVNGRNELVVELSGNSAFKNGKFYVMDVTLPDGTVKSLRFEYEDPNE